MPSSNSAVSSILGIVGDPLYLSASIPSTQNIAGLLEEQLTLSGELAETVAANGKVAFISFITGYME